MANLKINGKLDITGKINNAIIKKLYNHIIVFTLKNAEQTLYLHIIDDKSDAFNINTLVSWFVNKGYTATTVYGKAYPISGTNAVSSDYKPSIAISATNNIYIQTRESGNNVIKSYTVSQVANFNDFISDFN